VSEEKEAKNAKAAAGDHEPPAGAETSATWSGGATPLAYTVRAGWVVLRKKDKPAAEIFSVSYVAGSVILFVLLRRRLGRADGRRIASTLSRTCAAAALTALAAWATAEGIAAVLDVGRPLVNLVQVLAAVTAGVLAFVLGALIFQIEEADEVWRALAARFRR